MTKATGPFSSNYIEEHPYLFTHTGGELPADPDAIQPEHIRIADICRGLAFQTRYRGQTNLPYSIAEHSILVRDIAAHICLQERTYWWVTLWAPRLGLIHDAHEAYTGDLASPQKPYCAGWRLFEDTVEAKVLNKLLRLRGDPMVVTDMSAWHDAQVIVKRADVIALHREVGPLSALRDTPPRWYDPAVDALAPQHLVAKGWSAMGALKRIEGEMFEAGFRDGPA